ncbi:MAG: hypothetical protein OHK0038_13880 [Flammeovirgaceae bacterium]
MLQNFSIQKIDFKSITKKMLIGAFIGFVIISLFVFSVKEPNPSWGNLWMIRPLIITPLFGAFGGLFFYVTSFFDTYVYWKKVAVFFLSFFAFLIFLWIGIILGLDGTLWN